MAKSKLDRKIMVAAYSVMVNVATSGNRGKTCNVPLHEVPLMRECHRISDGLTVTLIKDWECEAPRVIPLGEPNPDAEEVRDFHAEVARLQSQYGAYLEGEVQIDIFAKIYGQGEHKLLESMRRIHKGFLELGEDEPAVEDLETLIRTGTGTSMDLDLIPYEPQKSASEAKEIDGDLVAAFREKGLSAKAAKAVARVFADAGEDDPTDAQILAACSDKAKLPLIRAAALAEAGV